MARVLRIARSVIGGHIMMVSVLLVAGSLLLAAGQPTAQEAEQYSVFYDAAADLDSAGQISTWEAFLKKYPRSPFAAKARETIAELRGERPPASAPAPKPAPVRIASTKPAAAPDDYDPDLSFLYEDAPAAAKPSKAVSAPVAIATPEPEPAPTPVPRPVAKPRPAPTPAEPSYFGSSETEVAGAQTSTWDAPAAPSSSGSMWDEAPAPAPRKKTKSRSSEVAMASPKSSRVASAPRPQRQPRPAARGEWRDTELAAFHGRSFGEEYVQSSLTGLEVSRRFGDRFALEVEGAAAASEETDTLRTLRAQGRQPVVITKFNFAAGGGVQFGVLAPGGRNDLFVLVGGGVINSDVEVCKKSTTESAPCEKLYFNGVNFDYAMAGVGHRFFVTSRIALHTELRGRYVFEKVDGQTNPRSAFQLNIGPSVSF